MALLRPPIHAPVQGGGIAPAGGTFVPHNPPPLYYASNRKMSHLSSSSPRIPTHTGIPFNKGSRSGGSTFLVKRPTLPLVVCFSSNIGGRGSGRDENGIVEDEDAGIDELLSLLQRKLVIDVHPLQKARREEEEAVRKGREMLYRQFCLHLGLKPQEFRTMWCGRGGRCGYGGGAQGRLRLVRDFLEEWGWRYQPLSPRAAVEMLDEHVGSVDRRADARPPRTTAALRRLLPNWWWC